MDVKRQNSCWLLCTEVNYVAKSHLIFFIFLFFLIVYKVIGVKKCMVKQLALIALRYNTFTYTQFFDNKVVYKVLII